MASKVSKRLKELDQKSGRAGSAGYPPSSSAPSDDELRVSWPNFIIFAVLGVSIVVAAAMFFGTRRVQGGLESSATAALRANEYHEITVSASGHDLTLKGTFAEGQSEEEAAAIVASLPAESSRLSAFFAEIRGA